MNGGGAHWRLSLFPPCPDDTPAVARLENGFQEGATERSWARALPPVLIVWLTRQLLMPRYAPVMLAAVTAVTPESPAGLKNPHLHCNTCST